MGEMRNVCEALDVRALKGDTTHCYEENINTNLQRYNL
jgi:hypothetical protein